MTCLQRYDGQQSHKCVSTVGTLGGAGDRFNFGVWSTVCVVYILKIVQCSFLMTYLMLTFMSGLRDDASSNKLQFSSQYKYTYVND